MKYCLQNALAAAVLMSAQVTVLAIEEAAYTVRESDDSFEVRDYAPHVVAETVVEMSLEEAGDTAFGKLFRYISGDNRTRAEIAMTAPVSQQRPGEKIQMSGAVGQQRVEQGWAVSFMMPAASTLEALPVPDDPAVTLREVPARRVAVVRYSGFWSEEGYLRNKQQLESWIERKGLSIAGDAIWARYNPPITPWFLRRNEILIPVLITD
ncbi:MAG: hypothetical protein ACI8W7_001603 [Gammaproteobacteria bacterium]|jgi:hypothetical protein